MTNLREFVSRQNLDRYVEMLREDHLSGDDRATLTRLLIEEERKLGREREDLEGAERRVGDGRARIDRLRREIEALDDGAGGQARRLLANLEETQRLLEEHYHRLKQAWSRNDPFAPPELGAR